MIYSPSNFVLVVVFIIYGLFRLPTVFVFNIELTVVNQCNGS